MLSQAFLVALRWCGWWSSWRLWWGGRSLCAGQGTRMVCPSHVSWGLHAAAVSWVLGGVVGGNLVASVGKRVLGEIMLGNAGSAMAITWMPLSCWGHCQSILPVSTMESLCENPTNLGWAEMVRFSVMFLPALGAPRVHCALESSFTG
jgi:hypothetical protein